MIVTSFFVSLLLLLLFSSMSYVSNLLQDDVVKISLHARAIRDAEDEELMGFFVGLSPWQVYK